MTPTQADLQDPALVAAVEFARAAAVAEAGAERVGEHVDVRAEDEASATHLFDAVNPGYPGWRWAVTVASAGTGTEVTVSEVVLVPGPDALVAPDWVPWQNRIQAGDLGVGDLMPMAPDDDRLVPAYLTSDDEAIEDMAMEFGLGRQRVMARSARLEAAARWQHSEFGPRSDMARSAPAHCGTCGFYLPLAGSLSAAFGTCGNEISPADAHVVHAEYGCGAHSEAEVEQVSPVLVADLIYDDAQLDLDVDPVPEEPAAAAAVETEPAADDVDDAVALVVEQAPAVEADVVAEPVAEESAVLTEPAPSEEPVALPGEAVAPEVAALVPTEEPVADSVTEPAVELPAAGAVVEEQAAEVVPPAEEKSTAAAAVVEAEPAADDTDDADDVDDAVALVVEQAPAVEADVVAEPVAEESAVLTEPAPSEEPVALPGEAVAPEVAALVPTEEPVADSVTEPVVELPAAGAVVEEQAAEVAPPAEEKSTVDETESLGEREPWASARPWGYVTPKQDPAEPSGE